MVQYQARGHYFEDFAVGQELLTARRTITEADVVSFAGISGDFNPLHMDEVSAEGTPFGTRVAHGMLVVSVGTGLVNQTGWFEGTTVALLELTCRFVRPVKFGDTIYQQLKVVEMKESQQGHRGVITFEATIRNQRQEPVVEGRQVVMLRRRP